MVTVADIAARSGVPVVACHARAAGGRHPGPARHRGARRAGVADGGLRAGRRRSWARRPFSPSRGCWAPPPSTSPRRPSRSSSRSWVRGPSARVPTSSPGPGSPRRRRSPSPRCPTSWRSMVMDAFERAQRRAEAARSWLGPIPAADGEAEGPTEVVALGFVDLVGLDRLGPDDQLARPEPGADPLRVGRLDERRPRRGPGRQDDRRRGVLRGPDGGRRLPDRGRGLPGGGRGRGPAPGPRGGGHRPRHTPGGRLLRAARQPPVPAGEDGRSGRARGDRGGGEQTCRRDIWSLRPLEPAELRGIEDPVRAFIVAPHGEEVTQI